MFKKGVEIICGEKQSVSDSVTEESGESANLSSSAPGFDSKPII